MKFFYVPFHLYTTSCKEYLVSIPIERKFDPYPSRQRMLYKRYYFVVYSVQEYLAGRTPVPCTLCNNYLKWPLLAKIADEMGVFYIATGHYAQNILFQSP